MSNPEDKEKHKKRIRRKVKEKVQSGIAKDLRTRKYKMRVVEDKRGNKHDLKRMDHKDLVDAIQELNED